MVPILNNSKELRILIKWHCLYYKNGMTEVFKPFPLPHPPGEIEFEERAQVSWFYFSDSLNILEELSLYLATFWHPQNPVK